MRAQDEVRMMRISCGEGEGEGISSWVGFENGGGKGKGRLELWAKHVGGYLS